MKADPTLIITAPTKLSSASTMCGLLCWVSGTGKAMTVNLLMGDILLPVSPGKARPKAVVECRYAGRGEPPGEKRFVAGGGCSKGRHRYMVTKRGEEESVPWTCRSLNLDLWRWMQRELGREQLPRVGRAYWRPQGGSADLACWHPAALVLSLP